MNQGQHIMAGVRAATQRYYGSRRKGQGRRLVHALAPLGRAAAQVIQAAQAWYGALSRALAGQQQDDLVVLSAAARHRKRHPAKAEGPMTPGEAKLLDMLEGMND